MSATTSAPTTSPPTTTALPKPAERRRWPIALGVGFSLTWVVGLSAWPNNLDVRSTGAQVVGAFTGHQGVAGVQYLLTEGLPALGLIALAVLLDGRSRSRAVLATGALAGLVSLVQTGLGLALARAVPAAGASTAHALFEAVNRLDGVKMFLLAGFALTAGPLFRRGGLPRWLGYAGIVLAVSIAVSGIGYLLLIPAAALAAWVSLPALLVWVTGSAIAIGRSTGR